MLDRFYVPESMQQSTIRLAGAEAQHLARVLRKQPGEKVTLFDGEGHEVCAQICAIERQTVTLNVADPPMHRPTTGCRVILASAVPKGDRARWLVEKATELGAAAWIPLLTERSVVDPRSTKLDKLTQSVVAACKQCGRNDLMRIHQPRPWGAFLDEACRDPLLLVADPSGTSLPELIDSALLAVKDSVTIAIGPEGGFTEEELDTARTCGAQLVVLGDSILRIETAAVAVLAAIRIHICQI